MAINYEDARLRNTETRKGEFREIARSIMWKDRDSRKHGWSVDTAGAIVSAMTQAYKLGIMHATTAQGEKAPPPDVPTWNAIPRRARDVFETIQREKMVVLFREATGHPLDKTDQWITYWDHGEDVPPDRRFSECRSYSVSTLAPLVKMGLMEEFKSRTQTLLATTKKGEMAWQLAIQGGAVR